MGEKKRKLMARDASNEENSVPGSHAPASRRSAHIMRSVMETLKEVYPDCDFAMFVFEPGQPGATHNGRYNYACTVDRADMNAVLRSFLARQEEMEAIDAAMAKAPEGRA